MSKCDAMLRHATHLHVHQRDEIQGMRIRVSEWMACAQSERPHNDGLVRLATVRVSQLGAAEARGWPESCRGAADHDRPFRDARDPKGAA